jgi:hypothetical protein
VREVFSDETEMLRGIRFSPPLFLGLRSHESKTVVSLVYRNTPNGQPGGVSLEKELYSVFETVRAWSYKDEM